MLCCIILTTHLGNEAFNVFQGQWPNCHKNHSSKLCCGVCVLLAKADKINTTHAHTRTHAHTGTHTRTQTDRYTDRQTDKQTDRQTDRHTYTHTHTHTHSELWSKQMTLDNIFKNPPIRRRPMLRHSDFTHGLTHESDHTHYSTKAQQLRCCHQSSSNILGTNLIILLAPEYKKKIAPWSSWWFEEISVALIWLALIFLALIWLALIWFTLIWPALIWLALIWVTFLSNFFYFFTQYSQLGTSFSTHPNGTNLTKWNFYTLFHNNIHISTKRIAQYP